MYPMLSSMGAIVRTMSIVNLRIFLHVKTNNVNDFRYERGFRVGKFEEHDEDSARRDETCTLIKHMTHDQMDPRD